MVTPVMSSVQITLFAIFVIRLCYDNGLPISYKTKNMTFIMSLSMTPQKLLFGIGVGVNLLLLFPLIDAIIELLLIVNAPSLFVLQLAQRLL